MKFILLFGFLLFSLSASAYYDKDSELSLGLDLLYNRKGQFSPQTGYKWLEQAALREDPRAFFNLGICCEQGLGTEKNLRLAADFYKRAAEKGLPHAKFNWALCVKDGMAGDQLYHLPPILADSIRASELLLELAKINFVPAQREYALLNRHEKKGAYYLEKAALAGDGMAQQLYGDYLLNKSKIEIPYEKVYHFYTLAAKQNFPDALAKRGWFIEQGLGTRADSVQAVECYKAAAQLKHAMGMTQYARCLIKGIGTKKNIDLAMSMLLICAANHHDPYAYYLLGTCSIEGIGQDIDIEAAKRFFTVSANMKYSPAIYQLAMLKWSQSQTRAEIKEVISLLEEAVNLGNADAMQTLGMMYIKGDQVPTDDEYGKLLLKKSRSAQSY